jgi:hypothetical protein
MKKTRSRKSRATVPLSKKKKKIFPQKSSQKYILLSTSERKTAFLAIFKPAGNYPFFNNFCTFWAAWGHI